MQIEKFECKSEFSFDSLKGIFSGYASVYGVLDKKGDIVLDGAYTNSIARWNNGEKIGIDYEHSSVNNSKSIIFTDNVLELKSDDKGLFVSFQISDFARKEHQLEFKSVVNSQLDNNLFMSITFSPQKVEKKNGIRYIKDLNLFNIALTTKPANTVSKILEMKSMNKLEAKSINGVQSLKQYLINHNVDRKIVNNIDSQLKDILEFKGLGINKKNKNLLEKKNITSNNINIDVVNNTQCGQQPAEQEAGKNLVHGVLEKKSNFFDELNRCYKTK